MDWVLGVDGGGSKTEMVAAGVSRPLMARVRVGGSSLSRRSRNEVAAVLDEGVRRVCAGGSVIAACGGFASAGDAGRQQIYRDILAGLLPRARIEILTDAELAWRGATGGADGIVVIAGTGSIAWGRYRGRTARAGGFGPGQDGGSADWIGRRAVEAGLIAAPADGNFAGLLPELARNPDAARTAIFRRAEAELAALAKACAAELAWPEPEVYAWGGVFAAAPEMGRGLLQPRMKPTAAALEIARGLLS